MTELLLRYLLAGVLVAGVHRAHLGWYRRHVAEVGPQTVLVWVARIAIWPVVAAFLVWTFVRGFTLEIVQENAPSPRAGDQP